MFAMIAYDVNLGPSRLASGGMLGGESERVSSNSNKGSVKQKRSNKLLFGSINLPSDSIARSLSIDSVQGTANHVWETKHSYLSNGATINFCVQEQFCSTNHLFKNSAK